MDSQLIFAMAMYSNTPGLHLLAFKKSKATCSAHCVVHTQKLLLRMESLLASPATTGLTLFVHLRHPTKTMPGFVYGKPPLGPLALLDQNIADPPCTTL